VAELRGSAWAIRAARGSRSVRGLEQSSEKPDRPASERIGPSTGFLSGGIVWNDSSQREGGRISAAASSHEQANRQYNIESRAVAPLESEHVNPVKNAPRLITRSVFWLIRFWQCEDGSVGPPMACGSSGRVARRTWRRPICYGPASQQCCMRSSAAESAAAGRLTGPGVFSHARTGGQSEVGQA